MILTFYILFHPVQIRASTQIHMAHVHAWRKIQGAMNGTTRDAGLTLPDKGRQAISNQGVHHTQTHGWMQSQTTRPPYQKSDDNFLLDIPRPKILAQVFATMRPHHLLR